ASQPKCGSNILLRVGVALSQSACGRDSTPAGMKNASQSHEKNSRASSTLTIITEKNPCACAIGISPASTPAASRYLRRGEGGREGETESVSILTCFPVTFSPCRLVSLFFHLPISPSPPSPPPPSPHPSVSLTACHQSEMIIAAVGRPNRSERCGIRSVVKTLPQRRCSSSLIV